MVTEKTKEILADASKLVKKCKDDPESEVSLLIYGVLVLIGESMKKGLIGRLATEELKVAEKMATVTPRVVFDYETGSYMQVQ